MKNKIQAVYPQSVFCSSTASKLYIADFSERTNSDRKVEFHEIIPKVPDSTTDMDCLVFENSSQLSVICNIFDDVTEYKRLHQKYKVRFLPTNSVSIVDEKKLIAKL